MPEYKINPQRKPAWLKRKLPQGDNFFELKNQMRQKGLATVCEEAACPNISECWADKTATIMILGDTCTRACKFCHVKTGNPKGFVNQDEITNASELVGFMNLRYVVITSVDRDDLPDYGATHFANVVNRIRQDHPQTKIEVLIPDFNNEPKWMKVLAESQPFVIAQNVETVERLTHPVRDRRAGYQASLDCLKFYKQYFPHISTKTSLMVGLGETPQELYQTMKDIHQVGVDIITFGQYLQPTKRHLTVEKYYNPEEFAELKRLAYRIGFKFVASGPMVRSSYKAADYLDFIEKKEYATNP